MKETVLLYNFDKKRLPMVRRALFPLKICVKAVEKEDFSQPIGYLLGMKDIEPADEKTDGGFDEEMLVMYGFTGTKIELLIRALNKNGVGRIPLKAVVTPTNRTWNGIQLYKAVKADHEEMSEYLGT